MAVDCWVGIVEHLHLIGFTNVFTIKDSLPFKNDYTFKKDFNSVSFEIRFTKDLSKFRLDEITDMGYCPLVDWFIIKNKEELDFVLSRLNHYQGIVQNCPSKKQVISL